MDEELPVLDVPETTPPPSSPETETHTAEPMLPPEAVPKRRGRPPGSKDTVKRVRRAPVTVRIEPVVPLQPEVLPQPAAPQPAARQPAAEPPTPRNKHPAAKNKATKHYATLCELEEYSHE